MKVSDFANVVEVQDPAALAAFLERRDDDGFNAFWCCHSSQLPALHVLANGPLACVAYYEDENNPEQYVKGGVVVSAGGTTEFRIDPSMDTEPRTNAYVVDHATAVRVAGQFMSSDALPPGVEWLKMWATSRFWVKVEVRKSRVLRLPCSRC